ncbi:Ctf8-domain-containing protein [Elsinoe ampelina]|uniref:Ctf8-domain-containing protein n=1 Tax=Elsinoe ampelina TaxID=302913 RepID=A0A6A6G5S5_9PEZI|nr:Ctf8-domain-containing protein [Elsinoe ampelina]
MPSIPLHPPSPHRNPSRPSPLPSLLQTPTGLAILELQGTIHFPSPPTPSSPPSNPSAKRQKTSPTATSSLSPGSPIEKKSTTPLASSPPSAVVASEATIPERTGTRVGHLEFPLYDLSKGPEGQGGEAWMKRVYFYVGSHQRMTGEVRRLGRPVAVIRRREQAVVGEGGGEGGAEGTAGGAGEGGVRGAKEELEIVEIVEYKIVFAARPEPVGGMEEG